MGGILQGIINPATAFPPAASTDRIVAIGAGTGQTGNRVFLAGQNAGQFTTMSDLVIIGNSDLSAGSLGTPLNLPALANSAIVGSQSAKVVTSTSGSGGIGTAPLVILGGNNIPAAVDANGSQLIGSNIFTGWVGAVNEGFDHNICIGDLIGNNLTAPGLGFGGFFLNVILGSQSVSNGAASAVNVKRSVVIGHQCVNGFVRSTNTGGPGLDQSVVIGHNAGGGLGNIDSAVGTTLNVIIGQGTQSSAQAANTNRCVVIGAAAQANQAAADAPDSCTVIGYNAGVNGTFHTVLGSSAGATTANTTRCIAIGSGSAANASDTFVIETNDGTNPRRTMFYGVMPDGASAGTGLIIGFSTAAVNRDLPGTTILKLLNGTASGVAPVGGGFFYSIGGDLHWVDTGNNDVKLSRATGQLAATATAYTNNAAAQAATLTNAPVAGNPTKWVPVNDNGTIRNMPMW